MQVKVEYYAQLREAIGLEEELFEMAEGSTLADLLDLASQRHPALDAWRGKILFAADLDYVESSHVISPSEVISFMPPLQGG